MCKHYYSCIILLFLLKANPAQLQTICVDPYGTHLRLIGNEESNENVIFGSTPLPDGGYIITGSDGEQALLSRYTSNDVLVWHRNMDVTLGADYVRYVTIDAEGYLIGIGKSVQTDNLGSNFAFKYNYIEDELLWLQLFSDPTNSRFECILQHPDNENYILGAHIHNGTYPYRGLLAELDKDTGVPVWQQRIEMEDMLAIRHLTTLDGKIYAGGASRFYGGLEKIRAAILRFDPDGLLVYSKLYMSSTSNSARTYIDQIIERDGILHFFSRGDLDGANSYTYTFQYGKVDPESGVMTFGMEYDIVGDISAELQNACAVPDGFLLFGSTKISGDRYATLIKINTEGNVLWSKSIGMINRNTRSGAVWFQNGFICAMATTEDQATENQDLLLIKLSPTGELGPNCECDWFHDLEVNAIPLSPFTDDLPCSVQAPTYGFSASTGAFSSDLILKETSYCDEQSINSVTEVPENLFSISPNPTDGHLSLTWGDFEGTVEQVELFNALGQKLWSSGKAAVTQAPLEIKLDKPKFQAGLHLCRIQTTNGRLTKQFLIIN
ncbi:MAG: T9SS type A sorting domain-containing protein [Phaeodactylibacter sp.]|nr:T9SS type A sorting domain-containing protein [Phaeodactylibacter sp.]